MTVEIKAHNETIGDLVGAIATEAEEDDKVYIDYAQIHKRLNWMDRSAVVALLESHSIACYDHETNLELNACVIANIEDGEISIDELEECD